MRKFLIHSAILAFIVSFFSASPSASAQTLTLNDASVLQPATKHIGINIGSINYYDNGQVLKNLVGALNPGFEPLTSKQIWVLTSAGTTTSFANTALYDSVPVNYWVGATFQIISSQTNKGQQGCTGTITANSGQVNISSISRSNGVVTVTTAAPSSYTVGNQVVTLNVADGSYNGYPAGTITSVSGNTITYAQSGANSTSSGGYVQQLAPPTYTTTACGGPFSVGDIVDVTMTTNPIPESWWESSNGGFWANINGGGKITSDTTDLCETCGSEAVELNATPSNSLAAANWYYDAAGATGPSPDIYVLMNGTYEISFWAKAAAGSPKLLVYANRPSAGGFSCGNYTQAPTSTWTQYTFNCTASESASGTSVGTAVLSVQATGGAVYLDNISFMKTGSTQPSVFRDEVMEKLASFSPGTLRYWLGQNGESANNWTLPDYQHQPTTAGTGYFVGPAGSGNAALSLEDYLVVAQTLNAEPYLEVPVTFSPADGASLIEFLAGSSSSAYGARRIALGQTAPWTSVFKKIHLSFCNECWNLDAVGVNLPFRASAPLDPNCGYGCPSNYHDYDLVAGPVFAAMRAAPDYSAAPFDLVMNVQTPGYFLAGDDIKVVKPDSVELEDYTYASVNDVSSDLAMWQPAFVEAYDKVTDVNDPSGFHQSLTQYQANNLCGPSGTAPCGVNIYEWADGTQSGSIDQAHLDFITAGAGQGIVAALEPLLNLQTFGMQNQNYFALTESYNTGPNGTQAKLWGNTVDMGGATNNVRPQFLAMQLANQSIIGPMYSCPIASNALFNFAGNTQNGTNTPPGIPALKNVPYLYSFCFENGVNRSLVLVNIDPTNTHTVSFAGTNVPQGAVTQRQYAPSSLDDLNEGATGSPSNHVQATVSIETSTLSSPTSVTLPAYSVTAFDYVSTGLAYAATPTFNITPGTYPVAQTVTISDSTTGASIYYTTNGTTPTTSSSVYSGPVTVAATETLQAIAAGTGLTTSQPVSALYTINPNVPAPTFSPAGGIYATSQVVAISEATSGTNIYYTTNGTTPTASSTLYTGPITVSSTQTLEATAIANGDSNSVAIATYTITAALAAPKFSLTSGTYSAAQSVTITDSVAGTSIYFTTNGSTPTTSSNLYTGAITVSGSETIEAFAVKSGYTNSSVASVTYSVANVLVPPSVSLAGGTYSSTQSVYVTGTPRAVFYYTTNGTTPTPASTLYTGLITVSTSETLEVIAAETGFTTSSPTTVNYVIGAPSSTGNSYINYAKGGFTATNLSMVGGASVTSNLLQLTDGGNAESRAAWYSTAVPVQNFVTDFTFQQLNAVSDGMTFTIESVGLTARGTNGGGLGYSGMKKSVAIKFDLHSNIGEGNDSTGIYLDGASPTMPSVNMATSAINLHSGHLMDAHMVYDGINLTMTLTDTVTSGKFTQVFLVDIPTAVGANSAYVGFTGGTGNSSSTQNVLSWTYSSTPEQAAAAPKFSEAPGTYAAAQTVKLTDTTAGSTIYYTSNGTAPTTSSAKYSGPITVSATESLRAIAVAAGYKPSAITTEAFDIDQAQKTYIAYTSNKITSTNLALNKGAAVKSGALQLTDGGADESRSVWYKTEVPVQNFVADFTFQQLNAAADGMTFTIQRAGTTAVGSDGMGLGFQGIADSIAVKFDLITTANATNNSTGLYLKGAAPTLPEIALTSTEVNLHSGHVMHAHMQYDGSNLIMTLIDTTTNTSETQAFAVNIPTIVGGDTAYVGFTGGTGSTSATQNVLSWSFLSSVQ